MIYVQTCLHVHVRRTCSYASSHILVHANNNDVHVSTAHADCPALSTGSWSVLLRRVIHVAHPTQFRANLAIGDPHVRKSTRLVFIDNDTSQVRKAKT
jgi:hypothetical protein